MWIPQKIFYPVATPYLVVEVEEKRKKEEIRVTTPRIEIPKDREKTEKEVQRKEERRGVIRTARGVGALISGLTIAVGLLVTVISAYFILTGGLTEHISTKSLPYIFQFTTLLLALINITSGLLLMGRGGGEEE